jgi:hypothetical protein
MNHTMNHYRLLRPRKAENATYIVGMSNQLLLPSAGGLAAAPQLNLDALDQKQLRDLCKGMFNDMAFLADVVPANVGSLISSTITAAAATAAGAVDGYLGDKANLGPVGLSAAVAVGMAGYAMLTKNPDHREAAAAVARGFGAPVLYQLAKGKVESWKARIPPAPQQPGRQRDPAGGGLPIA